MRINPIYTIPVQGDFTLFGKAGIAFIERDFKVSIRTEYELEDELRQGIDIVFPTSLQVVSESDSKTNPFASAGIKWSPDSGRFADSISYSSDFDTPGDIVRSLELDYQWKF